MAKFRPVPSLSPEDAFLQGANNAASAPTASEVPSQAPAPAMVKGAAPAPATGAVLALPTANEAAPQDTPADDAEVVTLTVRIRRRHYELLAKLAAAEERSLSQVARRILEPAIETRST